MGINGFRGVPVQKARRRATWAVACGLTLLTTSLGRAQAPVFSTFLGGSLGEFITGTAVDTTGNVYVAGQTGSSDFPVTAGAAQPRNGGGSDAFVAKYSPDGKLLWSTYFGGSSGDGARSLAVDRSGNVLVAGITFSQDLPVVNAAQPHIDNAHVKYYIDAFVLKLDTDGKIVYATYLGGQGPDWAWAIATDAQGNAYVTGSAGSVAFFPGPAGTSYTLNNDAGFVSKLDPRGVLIYSYFLLGTQPRGIAVDANGSAYITGIGNEYSTGLGVIAGLTSSHVFVAKLTPDGAGTVYQTAFGGTWSETGMAITVDAAGSAYVAGVTASADFPLVHPLQSSFGARTLWKSTDDGATWKVLEDPPFGQVGTAVMDPKIPGRLYVAAPDGGLFKSNDGGATWATANTGLPPHVQALVIDPNNPSVLYAGIGSGDSTVRQGGIYKSNDAGVTWTLVNGAPSNVSLLMIDSGNPATVYAKANQSLKSVDAGATWTVVSPPPGSGLLAIDPNAPGVVYANELIFRGIFASPIQGLLRSTDGGATWPIVSPYSANTVVVDSSHNPSVIYAGPSLRSDDGGLTWTNITPMYGDIIGFDPATGTVFANSTTSDRLQISTDRGTTWQPASGSPVSGPNYVLPGISRIVASPASPGTLYAVLQQVQSSAFVTKLSPDGSTILFSTFLHGHPSMDAAQNTGGGGISEVSLGTNGATGIALDPDGNIVVTGATRSTDFFVVNPLQPSNAGQYDSFASIISADGDWLYDSTYLGGGLNDVARAVAVDSQGNLIVAGQTYSGDFPVANAAQPVKGNVDDAFVTKITPQLPPGIRNH